MKAMGNQIIGRFSLKERRDGNFVPLYDHDLVRDPNLKGSFEIGTPIARLALHTFICSLAYTRYRQNRIIFGFD